MKTHNNATEALADAAQSLQDKMDKQGARANVIVAQNKMQTLNEYVFLFINNFNMIIKTYKLRGSEIKVLMKILEYMQFGNLITLSNSTLAKDLEMDKGNVSRIMKRFKESELIITINGSLFFNPHIACKGTIDERKPEDGQLLDYSAVILDEYNSPATVSIATSNIRKKNRRNTKTSNDEINNKITNFFSESNQ